MRTDATSNRPAFAVIFRDEKMQHPGAQVKAAKDSMAMHSYLCDTGQVAPALVAPALKGVSVPSKRHRRL